MVRFFLTSIAQYHWAVCSIHQMLVGMGALKNTMCETYFPYIQCLVTTHE